MKYLILTCTFLILLTGTAAYAATNTTGEAIFVTDTTIDAIVTTLQNHNLDLLSYINIEPYITITIVHNGTDIDFAWSSANDLKDQFWSDYAMLYRMQLREIERVEKMRDVTGDEEWAIYKQQIQNGWDDFQQNVDGCWTTHTCPTFVVTRAHIRGSILNLQALQNESIIDEIAWPELLNLFTNTSQPPEPAEQIRLPLDDDPEPVDPPIATWIPTDMLVEAGDDSDTTRFLDVTTEWKDPDRLAAFVDGSTYRQGVALNPENGTYFSLATIFLTNRPKLEKVRVTWPAPYIEQRGIFGPADYSIGVLRAELLKLDTPYHAEMVIKNGTADTDTGNLLVQFGDRICRLTICTIWRDKQLILNPVGLDLAFPGETSWTPLPTNVSIVETIFLPTIVRQ